MGRAVGLHALTNDLGNVDGSAGRAYSELNTRCLSVSKECGPAPNPTC